MIRVDVSEIKTFRECKRKHQFSSRNRFHLRPIVASDNLIFGTQFHEVLAMIYLGTDLDKILEWINREVTDSVHWKVMDNMTKGYYYGPYQEDKDRYVVIDIEHKFNYPIGIVGEDKLGCDPAYYGIEYKQNDKGEWYAVDDNGEVYEVLVACGSIDMICIDVETGKFVGFEHKTAKRPRPEVYNFVDEQPRLYSWALKKILKEYHDQGKYLEVTETGPILLNQVMKLQTKFSYERVPCEYSDEDLMNFLIAFKATCEKIATEKEATDSLPEPGYMKCQMCDYANLCMHYGYENIDLDDLKKEFDGEYEVREFDHLDEKASRHNEEAD